MCGRPTQLHGDTGVSWAAFNSAFVALGRFLSSVKMANREQKNVEHDEENPVNWGKEEVDSWLQLQWPQLGKRRSQRKHRIMWGKFLIGRGRGGLTQTHFLMSTYQVIFGMPK